MNDNFVNGYFYVANVETIGSHLSLKRTRPIEIIQVMQNAFNDAWKSVSREYEQKLQNYLLTIRIFLI